jgi:hypothetical protein
VAILWPLCLLFVAVLPRRFESPAISILCGRDAEQAFESPLKMASILPSNLQSNLIDA